MRIFHSGDNVDQSDQRYKNSGRFVRVLYSLLVFAAISYAVYFFGRPFLVLEGPGTVVAPAQEVAVGFLANVALVHVQPGDRVYPGALLVTVNRAGRSEALRDVGSALVDRAQDVSEVRQSLAVAERLAPTLERRMQEMREALRQTDAQPDAIDLITRAGLQREYSDARSDLEENQAQLEHLPDVVSRLVDDRQRLQRRRSEIAATWKNRRVVANEVGTVGTELVSEGDTVTAGETMARVFDHRQQYILWELPDDMLRLPYLGEAVTIETANMTIEGQVDRFAQQSGENRTINTNRGRLVYVSVDQAEGKRLALKTSVIVRMGYL